MRYYLYRHIRLDTGQPFYIGVGTKRKNRPYYTYNTEYERAFVKANRSNFWSKIVNKTGYGVEILFESDDYEFIKQKEVEFIALYGRRDLEKGILVNQTDGGEGAVGQLVSEENRRRRSENMKGSNHFMFGKNHTQESRDKISAGHKGIPQPKGEYSSSFGKTHSEETKNKISNSTKDIPKTEQHRKNISLAKKGTQTGKDNYGSKQVIDTYTGIIYDSAKEASNSVNTSYSNLIHYLKGRSPNKTTLLYLHIIEELNNI